MRVSTWAGMAAGLGIAGAVAGLALLDRWMSADTTITPPPAMSATLSADQSDGWKTVTRSDLQTTLAWLEQHRSGWRRLIVTPAPPTAAISLNTAQQKGALTLLLWTGLKYPGWNDTVILQDRENVPIGIQNFSKDELDPLRRIVEAQNRK